jgi:arginase family enzyme
MSGAYLHQDFYQGFAQVNCMDVPGTNGYCDEGAKRRIRKRLADFSGEGIHFLDSGNYHYLSLLWMEKLCRPFSLVLFDHHPDMQLPSFGEITSCGGWVREAMETLPLLQQVYLVGVPYSTLRDLMLAEEMELLESTEPQEERRHPSLREYLDAERQPRLHLGIEKLAEDTNPIYLSFDKDILGPDDCRCDWDQGDMDWQEASRLLEQIRQGHVLLGMDVCGEDSSWQILDNEELQQVCRINEKTNRRLLEFYNKCIHRRFQ